MASLPADFFESPKQKKRNRKEPTAPSQKKLKLSHPTCNISAAATATVTVSTSSSVARVSASPSTTEMEIALRDLEQEIDQTIVEQKPMSTDSKRPNVEDDEQEQYVSRLETLKDRARLFRERKLKKTDIDQNTIKKNCDDLHKGGKITRIVNSNTFNAEALWRERGFDSH